MHRLRIQVSTLVLLLAFVFGVGQALPDGASPFGSIWAFYVALGLATAIVLRMRGLAQMSTAAMAACVTGVFVLMRANPLLGAANWSTTDVFLTLLTVLGSVSVVLVARQVALILVEFEDAVANITFGDLARIQSIDGAQEDISVEMSRARRHERPLTVTVLEVDPATVHAPLHRIVREVQEAMMQRYMMSGLARLAAQTTRRGDIVVQDAARNRVIILSPEASPEQIARLADRLQVTARQRLGLPVRYGFAGFPHNALTFDELVEHATRRTVDDSVDVEVSDALAGPRLRQGWVAAAATLRSGELPEADVEPGGLGALERDFQPTTSSD
jgi:hypothetical protein